MKAWNIQRPRHLRKSRFVTMKLKNLLPIIAQKYFEKTHTQLLDVVKKYHCFTALEIAGNFCEDEEGKKEKNGNLKNCVFFIQTQLTLQFWQIFRKGFKTPIHFLNAK